MVSQGRFSRPQVNFISVARLAHLLIFSYGVRNGTRAFVVTFASSSSCVSVFGRVLFLGPVFGRVFVFFGFSVCLGVFRIWPNLPLRLACVRFVK